MTEQNQTKTLKELLVVGTQIELGKEYCNNSHRFSPGQIITLIEGWFEYENGLYTEDQSAPSIFDQEGREFDSIYHLFGNNLENFADCKVVPDERDSKIVELSARIIELVTACEAVKHALENHDISGHVQFILPPYQAPAIHETAWDRLEHVLNSEASEQETGK